MSPIPSYYGLNESGQADKKLPFLFVAQLNHIYHINNRCPNCPNVKPPLLRLIDVKGVCGVVIILVGTNQISLSAAPQECQTFVVHKVLLG